MKRYTPDCSMHMSHEMAFMRETPDGAYMEYQDHLPVKTQRDNLAIRVTELEQLINEYFYKFQKAQDANKHLLIMNERDKTEIATLTVQLASAETSLKEMTTFRDNSVKKIVELRTKLSTPVQLPGSFYPDGDIDCPLVVELDEAIESIRAAGFTVVRDGQ
ncbi:TPA: hypothetical protein ACNH4I_003301 [Serratia marcescens]|uniref:hypothetical protein n=1 Tax=Serratia marcescens TaxID=615 RepID=UPI001A194765|nr:hypothetical protein [Serratia marcescens]